MKKVKLSLTCPPMFGVYLDTLLARGLHGNNRAEVVRTLLGRALRDSLDGDTIRRLVQEHKGS